MRTRTGNWIFASGGNAASARAVGVPTKRVKIGLFAFVGFSAWFYAMHQLAAFNTVQAGAGAGGVPLHHRRGGGWLCAYRRRRVTAIGSAIGALIYGMTLQGIVYAGWDSNWFRFFLGAMLLSAVILNLNVKRMLEQDVDGDDRAADRRAVPHPQVLRAPSGPGGREPVGPKPER